MGTFQKTSKETQKKKERNTKKTFKEVDLDFRIQRFNELEGKR